MDQTVVFVCLHGAGKSRVAAALFSAAAPTGWRAVSAGLEPQAEISVHAARLLGEATGWLDTSPPAALEQVSGDLLVGIDCDVPGARRWTLSAAWPDAAAGVQLRTLTAALLNELAPPPAVRPGDEPR